MVLTAARGPRASAGRSRPLRPRRGRQPAPVQLGRDEEGAGLVQRGVVGVEVRPQPVVGAERDVAGVAGALDVDLAGRVAGDVGPAALAADAVVVEGLDHVAERDALGLAGVVLEPGGLVEHPGADARVPAVAGAQPLEVDQRREGLAAAGALGALVARQGPVLAPLAQHREQPLVGQKLRGEAGERRLVGAVAQVDGVAQDAAANRCGRGAGRAAAAHVSVPGRHAAPAEGPERRSAVAPGRRSPRSASLAPDNVRAVVRSISGR